ncbi:UDP-glycosyltransferase 87a2 [Phtheirospermum japonicum]|uniref:UDP-glycosyltransferase 87a2 n=1 Tax=Phtheirospermum japonicum TaxID=374723 RepID=A0A830AZS6_9LAMI|nr:UDP-glycosyltransferase 87a2 [Phtheirospermum japonicum]
MPYPGRGHINPMLNLCRLIHAHRPDTLISFIVTEEWLGFLSGGSEPPPSPNFRYRTIPNVIPSEVGRAKDFLGFFEATLTKMEEPVEQLLDRLEPPKPSVIIYDTYLSWVVTMGNRRNIPVASFYTMSATVFSLFHHSHLIPPNFSGNFLQKQGKEQVVNNIPGVPPITIADLPTPLHSKGQEEVLPRVFEAIKLVPKAQYLLFTSIYELESQVLESLRKILHPLKIFSLGLAILPHAFDINHQNSTSLAVIEAKPDYLKWLDAQPLRSVLYISQGSFLSVSKAQLDEIIAGVCASGVRFLWVSRGEAENGLQEKCGGVNGLVVPWCDQLKVLCHPSVGGFWSHCGWNSTKEGAFAGLPMLTFPIFWDQVTNSKVIVEDWKIGLRVKKGEGILVTRDEVATLVLKIMDSESEEAKERRRRAKEIGEICKVASAEGGSSELDLLAFIRDISREID